MKIIRLPLILVVIVSATPAISVSQTPVDVVQRFRSEHAPAILRDFARLLSLPNVAADREGIRRNAEYIRAALSTAGVDSRLLELDGARPIVYGELQRDGARRTLGLYAHYDGQPADTSSWTSQPWDPTLYTRAIRDGGVAREFPGDDEAVDPAWRIYARSAGDDKAPIAALLTVLRAFREHGIDPTVNLKFFFEGEEEAGSPNLEAYLRTNRALLDDIDLWLFLDGPLHQSRKPTLAFGVRGVTGMQLTVFGSNRPLHSGHYGNWAPVPGQMLANLLASMKNDSGRVLIDGFYDSVDPIGASERAALANLPDFDSELRRELGIRVTEGGGQNLAERLLLPSLTIKGLSSADVGPLTRNVIPATATAALGVRLVSGNDPEAMLDLVEAHIRRRGYHIVRSVPDDETRLRYDRIAMVTRGVGYRAARTSMDLPVVRELIAAARQTAVDDLILFPTLGGSLPLYLFTDMLGKPAVIVPIANHDDNQHAADENLMVQNLWYGIDLFASLLTM